MDEPFDELSKALAEGVSRRETLRRAGGLIAAVVVASLGLDRTAWGASLACRAVCHNWGGTGWPYFNCLNDCKLCEQRRRSPCGDAKHFCCSKGLTCCGTFSCCTGSQSCCSGTDSELGLKVGFCCDGNETCCHVKDDPNADPFCVDVKTTAAHCGNCNHPCAPTAKCCSGICCKVGDVCCPDATGKPTCADLNTDFNHCGDCGNACRQGEICETRHCLPVTCPGGPAAVCRSHSNPLGFTCCHEDEECVNEVCQKEQICPSDAGVRPCRTSEPDGPVTDCCGALQECRNGRCLDCSELTNGVLPDFCDLILPPGLPNPFMEGGAPLVGLQCTREWDPDKPSFPGSLCCPYKDGHSVPITTSGGPNSNWKCCYFPDIGIGVDYPFVAGADQECCPPWCDEAGNCLSSGYGCPPGTSCVQDFRGCA